MNQDQHDDRVENQRNDDGVDVPVLKNNGGAERAKSKTDRDQDSKIDSLQDEIKRSEKWMICLTGAMALFALSAVVVGILQWNVMSGQLAEVKTSSGTAKAALRMEHRARILIKDAAIVDQGGHMVLWITYVNSGRTPAIDVVMGEVEVTSGGPCLGRYKGTTTYVMVTPEEAAEIAKRNLRRPTPPKDTDSRVVTPDEVGSMGYFVESSAAFLGDVKCQVLFRGVVSYKDVFGDAHKTIMEYYRAVNTANYLPTNRNNKGD